LTPPIIATKLEAMKALSIHQPWAWAIMAGRKAVENRSWPTKYRGDLLIHAGRNRSTLARIHLPGLDPPSKLVFGGLIGVVTLSDCLPIARAPRLPFAEGPWCWILTHPRPLSEPIMFQGRLSLFNVPDHLVAAFLQKESPAPLAHNPPDARGAVR